MKILKNFLRVTLVVTTLLYPLLMCLLTAAGWQYQVDAGNYPAVFSTFAFWMRTGSVLLTAAAILCLCGAKPQRWQCNAAALVCAVCGICACLFTLSRFCAYADQNFPAIGETMQPVSDLFRDRIAPTILPFSLCCILSIWQLCAYETRVCRSRAKQSEEAPK